MDDMQLSWSRFCTPIQSAIVSPRPWKMSIAAVVRHNGSAVTVNPSSVRAPLSILMRSNFSPTSAGVAFERTPGFRVLRSNEPQGLPQLERNVAQAQSRSANREEVFNEVRIGDHQPSP